MAKMCGSCAFQKQGGVKLSDGDVEDLCQFLEEGNHAVCHTSKKTPCVGGQLYAKNDPSVAGSVQELLELHRGIPGPTTGVFAIDGDDTFNNYFDA